MIFYKDTTENVETRFDTSSYELDTHPATRCRSGVVTMFL